MMAVAKLKRSGRGWLVKLLPLSRETTLVPDRPATTPRPTAPPETDWSVPRDFLQRLLHWMSAKHAAHAEDQHIAIGETETAPEGAVIAGFNGLPALPAITRFGKPCQIRRGYRDCPFVGITSFR